MSETAYYRCRRCGAVGMPDELSHTIVCDALYEPPEKEPVEVHPLGTVAALRASRDELAKALREAVDRLQDQYDNEECECLPEGHMCGRDKRGWELKAFRAALARAEKGE